MKIQTHEATHGGSSHQLIVGVVLDVDRTTWDERGILTTVQQVAPETLGLPQNDADRFAAEFVANGPRLLKAYLKALPRDWRPLRDFVLQAHVGASEIALMPERHLEDAVQRTHPTMRAGAAQLVEHAPVIRAFLWNQSAATALGHKLTISQQRGLTRAFLDQRWREPNAMLFPGTQQLLRSRRCTFLTNGFGGVQHLKVDVVADQTETDIPHEDRFVSGEWGAAKPFDNILLSAAVRSAGGLPHATVLCGDNPVRDGLSAWALRQTGMPTMYVFFDPEKQGFDAAMSASDPDGEVLERAMARWGVAPSRITEVGRLVVEELKEMAFPVRDHFETDLLIGDLAAGRSQPWQVATLAGSNQSPSLAREFQVFRP